MPIRLRRHLSVPMFLGQLRARKFPQGCSFLASILLMLGFKNAFLPDGARRTFH
jgi:hypothetical protein